MAVSFAINGALANFGVDFTASEFIVDGLLTLTGSYGTGTSHGDTLSFSADGVPTGSVPNLVEIYEAPAAGAVATGYQFLYAPGTTQANGLLQIIVPGTQAEYTEGSAYSAGLLAAALRVRAWFPRL